MNDPSMTWQGAEILRPYLVPIGDLRDDPAGASGDPDRIRDALWGEGQVRPILVAENGVDVVGRQHLLVAARDLGWTHVAVRMKVAEEIVESADQMTLIEAVAPTGGEVSKDLVDALGRKKTWTESEEIEKINEESAAEDAEWVGLPEFVRGDEPYKVVISCETEAERDALFDVLGIATIHKGTRGTLSVWWPDRAKKDLASLRFVSNGGER